MKIQELLTESGTECANAWKIISHFATFGAFFFTPHFPILCCRDINIKESVDNSEIDVFNVFEYTFIQASLIPFFTSGHTLCYVTDGQNGAELVLTAWLSLPILVLLSILFDIIARAKEKI